MGIKANIDRFFSKETSIAPLVVFRIIFGGLMLFGISRFMIKGWVDQLYIQPEYYFGYLGFEWVTPLHGSWMYLPFILMLIASVGIIFGAFYRISSFIFFISFTYVELLDKSNYLNHYYFVSLMAFLMMLVPAHRYLSVDSAIFPQIRRKITFKWHIDIIKFQLACVYIFAGIAKINSDWLFDAQPLKTWLQAHHSMPVFGDLLRSEWLAYAFSWTGCFYDLFIVFFLIMDRTRPFAYLAVIFFHFVTWYLFPIGVFPWVMIFSTLIFFSPAFHSSLINAMRKLFGKSSVRFKSARILPRTPAVLKGFIIVYISAQILIPFRFVLYPGDLFWNEEGFRFSWRVMLMHKEGHATFYVRDPETGKEIEIDNSRFLTQTQEDQMATQPDMIIQYARILKTYYNGRKLEFAGQQFVIENPEVYAQIYVSLNGRPSQLFVDKKVDLSLQPYNLKHRDWIEPFTP